MSTIVTKDIIYLRHNRAYQPWTTLTMPIDEYIAEEQLLILDVQKADGRPETMNIINEVLRGRCEQHKPTFLVGEYIPQPVLAGIVGIAETFVE